MNAVALSRILTFRSAGMEDVAPEKQGDGNGETLLGGLVTKEEESLHLASSKRQTFRSHRGREIG